MSKTYRIVEKVISYQTYDIEAESPTEAYRKFWHDDRPEPRGDDYIDSEIFAIDALDEHGQVIEGIMGEHVEDTDLEQLISKVHEEE